MHQLLRDRRPSGLFRAAIAVLAMVVLVAACGDDGDAESDATPEETISSEATEDTTAAPELEGALVFAGGGGANGALYKRSAERRGGKECVMTDRSLVSPYRT